MKRMLAVCCVVGAACGAVVAAGAPALAWPGCPAATELTVYFPGTGDKYTFDDQAVGQATITCCACADPTCNK